MTDGRAFEDRLPWLEPAPRAAPPSGLAARRARTPLLVLLALLLGSAVAVMAFLVGRGTAPVEGEPSPIEATVPQAALREVPASPAPQTVFPPLPLPVAPPPTIPAAPPSIERPAIREIAPPNVPAPSASVPSSTARDAPARNAARRSASRASTARRAVAARPSVRVSQGVRVHRNTARARRYAWPAQATNRPSGRVVQLGAYRTRAEVGAAWRRLYRAYPYLGRLPRRVVAVGPSAGRPRYYRLRIGARSARSARGLCTELHRRGRGCIVV